MNHAPRGRNDSFAALVAAMLVVWQPSATWARAPQSSEDPGSFTSTAMRDVLKARNFPWYDPETDRVKSLLTPERPGGSWSRGWFEGTSGWSPRITLPDGFSPGALVPALFFAAAGTYLTLLLYRLWRQRESGGRQRSSQHSTPGTIARIGGLPGLDSTKSNDPWGEAERCLRDGDRSAAVVWLFSYQLEALERLNLVRPVPGRTARQYVASVQETQLRGSLSATLGLFETVYYGHQKPNSEQFDEVWRRARLFREFLSTSRSVP